MEILPVSFDENLEFIKNRVKDRLGLQDVDLEMSNISQLCKTLAYASTLINTQTAFTINETFLSQASSLRSVLFRARELGYEPKRRTSYLYRIKLKAKKSGIYSIPRFTRFTCDDKSYYYLGEEITKVFGESAYVTITNRDLFDRIKEREGFTSGSFIATENGDVCEVLQKVELEGKTKFILSNITGDKAMKVYSNTPNSLYIKQGDDYLKVAEINAFTRLDGEVIIQLQDIVSLNMPYPDQIRNYKFFTDDFKSIQDLDNNFDGFIASEWNEGTQVLKIQDNNEGLPTLINGKTQRVSDMLSKFRKTRCSLIDGEPQMDRFTGTFYQPDQECLFFESIEFDNTLELEVKEGNLDTWELSKDLGVQITSEIVDLGYIPLNRQNIEQDGVFLYVSRINKRGEAEFQYPWSERTSFTPPSPDFDDRTFILQREIGEDVDYYKVYPAYAGIGTPLVIGGYYFFKILTSSGKDGEITSTNGLLTLADENSNFDVVNYYENRDTIIPSLLIAKGTDEEDIETIRINAPLASSSSNSLVTKKDYYAACKSFPIIEQSMIWGGEELVESKKLGNVFFSFIPASRLKEYKTTENKDTFSLMHLDVRDSYFIPEKQILEPEDGGNEDSIFAKLSNKKVITLKLNYVAPVYVDFTIKVKIYNYNPIRTEAETRQIVFDAIRKYFDQAEIFEGSFFESTLVKYIDQALGDNQGVTISVLIGSNIQKEDFIRTSAAEHNTADNYYSNEILFMYPKEGVFAEDVKGLDNTIIQRGYFVKERIPIFEAQDFLETGDFTFLDFDNIKHRRVEDKVVKELITPFSQIDSTSFYISVPFMYSKDGDTKEIGSLEIYPENEILYLKLNATDSDNPDDLESRLSIRDFDEIRELKIGTKENTIFTRNTFPRLVKVEFQI